MERLLNSLSTSDTYMRQKTWPIWFCSWLIACSNAGLMLIEPLGTKFSEVWIKTQQCLYKEIYLKISLEWRPCSPDVNVLTFTFSFSCLVWPGIPTRSGSCTLYSISVTWWPNFPVVTCQQKFLPTGESPDANSNIVAVTIRGVNDVAYRNWPYSSAMK